VPESGVLLSAASATPLATNRVRTMVANNTTGRLIRRAAFLGKGRGEKCSVTELTSSRL
jgi:hypothetical protein